MKITTRHMLRSHLDAVLKIERRISCEPWDRQDFHNALHTNALGLVAEKAGHVVGYAILDFGISEGNASVMRLCSDLIVDDNQVVDALISAVIATAHRLGKHDITVIAKNYADVFRKHGFTNNYGAPYRAIDQSDVEPNPVGKWHPVNRVKDYYRTK